MNLPGNLSPGMGVHSATVMDVSSLLSLPESSGPALSALARGVIGSEILKISADIRGMKARGITVCNLTVGDFDPAHFPIPGMLLEGIKKALVEGNTNYPPSDGVLLFREAIVRFYSQALRLTYPVESVLVASGARPLIYATYQTVVDPGDTVVYPVPSWNNNHYCHLTGARPVEVVSGRETGFFPDPAKLAPHLENARLLVINSPLNPTGTVVDPTILSAIASLVVAENNRRLQTGARPLFLLYDQVYWTLTFGDARHCTPVELVPEVAPYTILLDAVSKSFCGTGLRVGWALMPPAIRNRMADIVGHIGAWAPKAEQVATARLLDSPTLVSEFHRDFISRLRLRLDALYEGFEKMRAEGLPIEVIPPEGAIYLTVRFPLFGGHRHGVPITTNEQIRTILLEEAGIGIVPFQAFGLRENSGWFRLSVGSVSMEDIESALPRVQKVLHSLRTA